MNVVWRKVWRDLMGNKVRTILVVLSIAVGVFAVGAVTHTFTIVSQELAITYPKANPAAATIYTEAFDDDLVQMVRRMPGVGEVEPRTMTAVQMQVGDRRIGQLLLDDGGGNHTCDDVGIHHHP